MGWESLTTKTPAARVWLVGGDLKTGPRRKETEYVVAPCCMYDTESKGTLQVTRISVGSQAAGGTRL